MFQIMALRKGEEVTGSVLDTVFTAPKPPLATQTQKKTAAMTDHATQTD